MTKINPCRHCKGVPSSGYYPGDFAIECDNCLSFISRHMIDFPNRRFRDRARLAKACAIGVWNCNNPIPTTT